MSKLKVSSSDMVEYARNRIEEIETSDAMNLFQNEDVVVVDIRDIRERQHSGIIPGSFHCPRGMVEFWIDPASPYHKSVFSENKKFVFHCASGWRSALTVSTINDMGFAAAHLKNGFSDWKNKGGLIERLPTRH